MPQIYEEELSNEDIIEIAKEAGFRFRSDEEGAGVWFKSPHDGTRYFVHIHDLLVKFAHIIQKN